MDGDKRELNALNLIAKEIQALGNSVAIYRDGPFFDFIMGNQKAQLSNIWGVVDSKKDLLNILMLWKALQSCLSTLSIYIYMRNKI
jgi:hypothetical protein